MDLEYWKQRAIEAEQALKDAGGTALDATKRAVDMGKAKMGIDLESPLSDQITEPVGQAASQAGDAISSKAGDLKTLFLDTLVPPKLDRPQPGQTQEPAPRLNRPQPGQRADAPGNMEQALKAAEEAFNSVMKGAGGYADSAARGVGKGIDAVGDTLTAPFEGVGQGFQEGFQTELMNQALQRQGMPPVPNRDPEDPYYGREYPRLQHPQPGQDWQPPGEGPVRGEEMGWPWYMPQVGPNGRPRAPIPDEFGRPRSQIRRT